MAWCSSASTGGRKSLLSAKMALAGSKGARDEAPSASFLQLSMYDSPPPGEVAIEDFERLALERLKGEQALGTSSRLLSSGCVLPVSGA